MEMAKDFLKDCPDVKITIAQNAADYTVLLNHIEVGVFVRDNQVQVADRNGDMLVLHEGNGIKSGSIRGSVKIACRMIMEDWRGKGLPDPLPAELSPKLTSPVAIPPAKPVAAQPEPPPTPSRPKASEIPDSTVSSVVTSDTTKGSIGASSDEKPTVRHDGVTLSRVIAGGPCDKAGIIAGDVILAIDGHFIYTVDEMQAEIRDRKAGTQILIRYRGVGLTTEVPVILISEH